MESRVLQIIENHPAIVAIRSGQPVGDLQLISLERTLTTELSRSDIQLSNDNIRRAYGFKVNSFLAFLRHLLELDDLPDYSDVVRRCFVKHVAEHAYNADQIRFLRAVEDVFLQKRKLESDDFYEPPLTNFGRNAVDRLFSPAQLQEIISFTNQLSA